MEERNIFEDNPRLKPFTWIYKFNGVLEGFIALFLLVIMTVMVVGRYLFKLDLNAADEYMYFALVWSIFLGGAAGSYEKSHLKADTIAALCKNKVVLKINAFLNNTLTLIIVGAFVYFAVLMVMDWFQLPTKTNVHRMPFLIGYSAVLVGGILMFIYTAFHYYSYLYYTFGKGKKLLNGGADNGNGGNG